MPYNPTSWVNGSTALNSTHLNNLETQYNEATQSFEQDLFTPFVLTGFVATKDGTIANQLDVTTGTAFLRQSDTTLRRRAPNASTQTTATPSTTYYLFLNNDGTWTWGTASTGPTNSLAICQVTTDGSGNILAVTDERVLTTTMLTSASGPISIPAGLTGATVPQIGTTNAGSTSTPQIKAATNTGLSVEETTSNSRTLAALIPTNNANGTVRGTGLGYVDAAGAYHLLIQCDDTAGLKFASTGAIYRATSFFSGTGSGTYSHGFPGTPSWVGLTANEASSSQTVGVDSLGSSTVHCTMPNSWPFYGMVNG